MSNPDLRHAIHVFAAQHWPDIDWRGATVHHGAFHDVLVCDGGPVLRVATGGDHQVRVTRETRTLNVVAGCGLAIPTPEILGQVATDKTRSGVLTTAIPGATDPDREWDAQLSTVYRALLDQLAAIPVAGLTDLDPPRTWCGGSDWPTVVNKRLCPLLPRDVAAAADAAVHDVVELDRDGERCLVHGDFGRHNILWQDDQVSGLIDFDHACIGDPAIDLAPLVVFHGAAVIHDTFGRALADRAVTHAASLSLQIAAAAELSDNTDLRDHALGNFVRRYQRRAVGEPPATGTGPLD